MIEYSLDTPQEEPISENRSFWIETYDELIKDAEKAVERAEEEKKQQEAVTTTTTSDAEDVRGDGEGLIVIEVPPRENNTEVIGMPNIEGVFTNRPAVVAAATAAAAAEGTAREDVDTEMDGDASGEGRS